MTADFRGADLAGLLEPLALRFFGKPSSRTKTELRFGSHGSMAVDLSKGVWYDHEAGQGGGVLDLVGRETGLQEDRERFRWLEAHAFLEPAPKPNGKGKAAPRSLYEGVVATYDYVDENGALLSQTVRYAPGLKPRFRQRRPDGRGGWTWSLDGVRRVPYRLPELIEALSLDRVVAIVEGEKDVDRLWSIGLPATCNAMGAGKWKPGHSEWFIKGADVVVVGDLDSAGQEHAQAVARALHAVARRVRVLDLSTIWPEAPLKADVSDWLDLGNSADALYAAVERLPDWTPEPEPVVVTGPWERGAEAVGQPVAQLSRPGPSRENLLLSAWLTRELPLRDFLLGNVFCTTSRWLIFGDTGVGKTLFALSLAAAIAAARPFLGWAGRRRARVMYLDGEMPAETFKERMQLVAAECGEDVALYGYNRDVLEPGEMPPLNTPEGEAWLMREIETVKPDVIVFDSVMSLLIGTMGEEESWAPVKLLARTITSKRIGQIWLHHTGHDTSKSFGTKTREWEMDTVVKLTSDDPAILMEFRKARLRTPQNKDEFEPRSIVKDEHGWRTIAAKDAETRAAATVDAMTQLLLAIEADPDGTIEAWAEAAGLSRSKAYRVLSKDLVTQKYVHNTLGKWALSTAGRKALKSVFGGETAFHFVKRNEQ